jgi:hypothetical protein
VVALFEREEDADAAVLAGVGTNTYDEAYTETFTLFPAGALPRKVAYWRTYASVNADGTQAEVSADKLMSARAHEGWTGVDPEIPGRRPTVTVTEHRQYHDGPVIRRQVQVIARTEQAAIKACSDAVAKLRAEALESEQAKETARLQRIAVIRERKGARRG